MAPTLNRTAKSRRMSGESMADYLIRKHGLGQSWGYTPGCMCEGCKAWRRYKGWKQPKARA